MGQNTDRSLRSIVGRILFEECAQEDWNNLPEPRRAPYLADSDRVIPAVARMMTLKIESIEEDQRGLDDANNDDMNTYSSGYSAGVKMACGRMRGELGAMILESVRGDK